ncbi:MAG: hypothetical protein ACAH21_10505 [Ramlibacter sp.]|nr:hypothetical protein [Ramlibacter sp.]
MSTPEIDEHDSYAPPEIGSLDRQARARNGALVPTLAVGAVVIAAVVAAVMSRGTDPAHEERRAARPALQQEVVRAPPLHSTQAMGAAPACGTCGTVEAVTAAASPSKNYQMRIRMDDGSVRSIEQRGALPAGSRVVLDGNSVRLMPREG